MSTTKCFEIKGYVNNILALRVNMKAGSAKVAEEVFRIKYGEVLIGDWAIDVLLEDEKKHSFILNHNFSILPTETLEQFINRIKHFAETKSINKTEDTTIINNNNPLIKKQNTDKYNPKNKTIDILTKSIKSMRETASNAPVNSKIHCPVCRKQHKKTVFNKVYCSNNANLTCGFEVKSILDNSLDAEYRIDLYRKTCKKQGVIVNG
jgi:hypothetical protein